MKMKTNVLFLLFISIIVFSCNNDDNKVQRTFIDFSVAGPSMNGTFHIEQDEDDPLNLAATALYVPESGDDPSVIFLTYQNQDGLSVAMQLPGSERLTELVDDHDHFGMAITSQQHDIILISKTLSMDVTRLRLENQNIVGLTLIDEMIGNFTGIMVYEYWEDGEEIMESHIVEGKFEYAHF